MNAKNYICLIALFVRLIVLTFVVLLSDQLTTGFISSDVINDDVRYLAGAEIYSNIAQKIIDIKAFQYAYLKAGDWVVAQADDVRLWYWIVSVGMYIFHSHIVLRFINILYGVLCVRCIYDIAIKIYGEKIAKLSSLLYAILPYPVFFSCFLYKDQLYTLVFLLLLRIILKGKTIKIRDTVYLSLLIIISLTLRTGLIAIIVPILLTLFIWSSSFQLSKIRIWIITILMIVGCIIVYNYSEDNVLSKYTAYVEQYDTESFNINSGIVYFFSIKSINEIYLYPFALLFAMLLPINLSLKVASWSGLTGILNIVVLPLAVGCFLYLINFKLKKNIFYWCIQLLYLITIITSLGIFRHHYYLQPFMCIFFSCFFYNLKMKKLYITCSFIGIIFYLFILIRMTN